MWTITKILHPVNGTYGAPHGRSNVGVKPTENIHAHKNRVHVKHVPLCDGGYDKGGAYWGIPNNLYVEFTKDLKYIMFFRKYRKTCNQCSFMYVNGVFTHEHGCPNQRKIFNSEENTWEDPEPEIE